MFKKKLSIITSHPIQYYDPLFVLLAKEPRIDLKVFYTWGEDSFKTKFDPDFQQNIKWDIPLLNGYNFQFLNNTSKEPGSHHFKGIVNPDLNKEIEEWGADIVWIWGWAFDSHLKALLYFKGKKEVWFRGDSTLLDEPNRFVLKKIVRRIFLKWLYRHVDKAFYVGTNNKAYFLTHGLKENQLVFSPHAIDNDRFSSEDASYFEKAKLWRQQLKIDDNEIVFLFVGKLERKKNVEFLINAFVSLEKPIHLVIVGSGALENKLKSIVSSKYIHFIEFQNQRTMPVVYRIGDIFVLPSIGPGETWGLSVNEAMASGLPILVSNKCGCYIDLVLEGQNGFVFDPYDLNDLVKKIELFKIKNLPLMGNKSKEIIRKWTYKTISEEVIQQLDF